MYCVTLEVSSTKCRDLVCQCCNCPPTRDCETTGKNLTGYSITPDAGFEK